MRLVGPCRSLVDVGAGCGMLGALLVERGERWTAIEPSRYMRGRIRQRGKALAGVDTNAIAVRWEEVDPAALKPHDVAMGANIGGPMQQPLALLAFMRRVATRRIAWSVSAQHGPRTFCLSGLLPPEIHGLDTRPGRLYTLEALGKANQPDRIELAFLGGACLAMSGTRIVLDGTPTEVLEDERVDAVFETPFDRRIVAGRIELTPR